MVIAYLLYYEIFVGRINRLASEDIVINGVKIPKGLDVTYTPRILHFLPDYWEEPLKYMPERLTILNLIFVKYFILSL